MFYDAGSDGWHIFAEHIPLEEQPRVVGDAAELVFITGMLLEGAWSGWY